MRTLLNKIYLGSGLLSGAFIVLIMLMILSQIVGRWFDVIIPSTEDFSGYFLTSSVFFALAYTFNSGGHIRVTLVTHKLSARLEKFFLIITLVIFAVMTMYALYYTLDFVYDSWRFAEVSHGYIAVPLWIVQLPMALGVFTLLIALVDDLFLIFLGKTPAFTQSKQ